jgi:hypothetical protein
MYISNRSAARKRKKMQRIFNRSDRVSGAVWSLVDRDYFQKYQQSFWECPKVVEVWQGQEQCLIGYNYCPLSKGRKHKTTGEIHDKVRSKEAGE